MGIEFAAANPGSSFEGLQESLINYGNPANQRPEFITALHEEASVALGHGYAKATGKPMLAVLHGTLGIQHASMAIYNAFYDKVPILMIAGNDPDFIPAHTAHDMAGMCRSFTKWDAQPKTIEDSLVAIQRAYNEAITPPMAPTLVVLDTALQKDNAPGLKPPPYKPPQFVTVDSTQAREIAKGLVSSRTTRESWSGRLRTPEGVKLSVELAELVGASTSTAATNGPMSFPQTNPLCGPGADTILRLHAWPRSSGRAGRDCRPESGERSSRSGIRPTSDSVALMASRGAAAEAPEAEAQTSRPIAADAEASLPLIIEEVKKQLTSSPEVDDSGACRETCHCQSGCSRAFRLAGGRGGAGRVGWKPDQHGAGLRGTLAADRKRGLVPFLAEQFFRRP